MAETNIILLSWEESSKAYETFSKFRAFDFGDVTVGASAVVERTESGELRVTDGQDNALGLGTLGGGSLGTLLGIVGGPLGVLLGFASGSLIGSAFDLDRSLDSESVIGQLGRALPPGRTAIIAEVIESTPDTVDGFANDHGAQLVRHSEDDVLAEIAASEEAADAAARAADEKVREAKKEARSAKVDEQVAKFRERRDEQVAKIKQRFQSLRE